MRASLITIIIFLSIWAVYRIGRYYYFRPNVHAGQLVPTTILRLRDGSEFSLESLKGKYVLLHFWGSWCGPCRRESPHIRSLYEKFHDARFGDANGFEILSVGIEKNEARWSSAILADRLDWKLHASDLTGFDSGIAKLYGVRQIPTLLLIGPDQRIIGSVQSPESIDKILTEKRIQ